MQSILTVTVAATSYDLTTLAIVKDELGETTNANNATLSRYLGWASAALAQACNRVFPVEALKEEFWPARERLLPERLEALQLLRWPLVTVTSVTENGTPLVDVTDFRSNPPLGQLIRLNTDGHLRRWPACPLVVQYTAGFATIPGDVADAVTRMVRNRFRAKGRDTYLISENVPGVRDARWWIATGNEAGNMPPDVADLVENYRVPVIA